MRRRDRIYIIKYTIMLIALFSIIYVVGRELAKWRITDMRVTGINGNEIIAEDIYGNEWAFYGDGYWENEVVRVTMRDHAILAVRER